MTTEEERAHNRVCSLAIERVGGKVKSAKEQMEKKPFHAINTLGWVWLALEKIHMHCKKGLDKGIFETYTEYPYLDIIMDYEELLKESKEFGVSFGYVDIDKLKKRDD